MKRISSIILLLLIQASLYADEPFFANGFAEGAVTYIFAENVRIRTSPEIKDGNVADTLGPGHEIAVIKNEEGMLALNGLNENWLSVKYKISGKERIGYVWGGLLAVAWVKSGSDLVLAGLKKYSESAGLEAECRIVRGGKIISSLPVDLHYLPENEVLSYRYSVSMALHDSRGLSGLEKVVSINCSYGACAYPYGNVWVGIAKGKLYYLVKDSSVSEGGVFHVEEKVVFPADDKSLKDEVIVVTESSDFDEELNDYRLKERRERRLRWRNLTME